MDPDHTLRKLLESLTQSDQSAAPYFAEDLLEWLTKNGSVPDLSLVDPLTMVRELCLAVANNRYHYKDV